MRQSRIESIIETILNTSSGIVISYIAFQYFIAPALDIPVTHGQNLIITLCLTTLSVCRGYFWKRFFVNDVHNRVRNFLRREHLGEDD